MMKAVLILAFASLLRFTFAGYWDKCEVDVIGGDILGYYRNKAINDTTDGEFFKIERGNITEVEVEEGGYITAQIIEDVIVFSTTERFRYIEYEMENSNYRNEFTTTFVFNCKDGSETVRFIQPILDVNQYAPFFNRKKYVYRFGMPIAKGFDLTNLLDVLVTDVDLTDNKFEYKIFQEEEFLKIESKGSYTWGKLGKTKAAKIVTLKEIPSDFKHSFEIVVDDTRNKTGNATVVLQID